MVFIATEINNSSSFRTWGTHSHDQQAINFLEQKSMCLLVFDPLEASFWSHHIRLAWTHPHLVFTIMNSKKCVQAHVDAYDDDVTEYMMLW